MPSGGEFAPVLLDPNEFLVPLGFLPFPNVLHPYIAAFALETFFYGIYSVLFTMCLYVLIRRRTTIHWILPVLTIVMFSIATADISYSVYLHFQYALKGTLTFHAMRPKYWFFVTNNILADGTFLYRCYVVWGGDLRVLAVPGLLFIASVVCGYVFEVSPSMAVVYGQGWKYITVTFVLNVILTGLTASRIWWFSWKRRDLLNSRSRKRYQVALASVLESGMLVALYMIPEFIIISIILDNTYVQVCGIVPTLIVVQVGLGRAINPNAETAVSGQLSTMEPMQAAERSTTKSHVVSFFSNIMTQNGKGQSKSTLSSSSFVLRTGDVEDSIGEKRDSTHEKSTGGRGPETV